MIAFRALTRNTVRASLRNRTALFFTLGLAVLFMLLFGTIFGTGSFSLRIGVVDDDGTATSARFIGALRSASGVSVDEGSQSTEVDNLKGDRASIVAVIPSGFGAAAAGTGPPVRLGVLVGNNASQTAGIAQNVLGQVVSGFASGGQPRVALGQPQTASVNAVTTIDFFLPAMIAYIVLQSGINYVAIGLVELRVRNVLRRLRATPLTPAQIVGSQVAAGAVTVVLQIAVLVLLGTQVFRAHVYGSWLVAAVPIALGTLAFVGIGFLLTSAVRTSEAARGIAAAIAFPMMFLSGIFIPLDQLPSGLQSAVHVLPLTWLSDALHQVFNDGAPLGSIGLDCLVLAAWAAATFGLATWRFRWE